ncbi:carbonic anhydrase [Chloroflexota bacterium]
MSFCTSICCIDGRIQLPVIAYLQNQFGVEFVDNVTESGPVGVLIKHHESRNAESIFKRVDVSIRAHASKGMAIVAHHDCAGNPVPDSQQVHQIQQCIEILSKRYPHMEVIGLWLDKNWNVHEHKIGI